MNSRRFEGLSHAEMLAASLPPQRWLIDGVIERATLGVLCGLPGAFKSVSALELAFAVASGRSWLGRKAFQGSVGVWAEDGSRNAQLRRAKTYACANGLTREFGFRWHLSEGLVLPADLEAVA